MKIKIANASPRQIDWLVAKCMGGYNLRLVSTYEANTAWQYTALTLDEEDPDHIDRFYLSDTSYTTDWTLGGPIIEEEEISVIRCVNAPITDTEGFWHGNYEPRWAAVIGDRHNPIESYGSQGNYWGSRYEVDENAVVGSTPLIAAMRCYVVSKLNEEEVEVPEGLI